MGTAPPGSGPCGSYWPPGPPIGAPSLAPGRCTEEWWKGEGPAGTWRSGTAPAALPAPRPRWSPARSPPSPAASLPSGNMGLPAKCEMQGKGSTVLLAAGAGAAIERDMAAALPPPPPLPATAFFRCHWRTDSRRRRRASATAFRRIFPLRGWSRAALTMASACRVLSAQRLCCSGEERLAFRKVATSFAASPRIRLASACAALTICVAASVASCNTFAAGVECHSSMELRSAWLGMSTLLGSCAPVLGLVLFVASQRSMLARS